MANQTNININVKVDDKQVNNAVKSTESLRREIKQLEVELTRVEIGSKEFETLSERLKDNRDKLDLVRAKSRDLFESFSLLPGPIGAIGSATDQSLGKLKILSSFNLKDVKGQFKAIGDDVKQVGANIGKATGITKLYETTVGGLGKAFKIMGVSTNVASKAASGFGKALIATGIGAIVVLVGSLIANFDSFKKTLLNLIPGLGKVADFIGGLVNSFTDLIGITNEAERAEARRQATYAKAKAATDIVNQGIQRQINLLQAQGASQDEIDKKRKEMITNELNDLKKAANERGVLVGEQATQYKDLQNQLQVIDLEANKRRKDEADAQAKGAKDRGNAAAKQTIADRKAFLQAQSDAEVQLLKDSSDTNEAQLREALKKQFALRNEGKKLSVEVQQQQAAEIDKIVKDELAKDVEDRKKVFDDRIKMAQDLGKIELDTIDVDLEAKKLKYGEDSKEYRDAQQAKFDKQFELLTQEENILKEKEKTKDGLTTDELNRLKSIQNERGALTNTVKATNDAQVKSDREKAAKILDDDKKAKDEMFANQMANAGLDFELQQQILKDKLQADREYFAAQEALYEGNKEKLDEIDRARLASQATYAQSEEQIRRQQVSLNLQAADAAINALGAQTAAGKAALIAKQFILAKELVLEVKRTITFAKLGLTQAKVSTAVGAANTAKVGFPQNIPLLILYAAQAVSIIKTVIDATKMANEAGAGGGGSTDTGSVPSTGTQVPRPRGMATGGLVQGLGGPKSDLIPAMLSNGESVINAQSTSMFRPLLSTINEIGGGKRFAEGGLSVSSFSQDQTLSQLQTMMNTQQTPIRTYVVASDMTNQQMMDRNIKDRSTL
jgi:hypothetical protein